MSVAPGDCNPTRAVCRFIAQSRARTGSFCGSVKGRPASLYVGWVSEAHPPGLTTYVGWVSKAHPPGLAILLNHGLSPLTRGTHAGEDFGSYRFRFIPARAGNTARLPRSPLRSTVYPRSRGEHPPASPLAAPAYGLSPLARGTLRSTSVTQQACRFIPARAGNT